MKKLNQLPKYVKQLLICTNLFSAGRCVVAAFIAVYFIEILKLPAHQTALIMSTAPITSQVMKTFIGFVSDRVGYRYTIGIGIFFECIGYIGYATTSNFYLLVLSAFCVGFGAAIFSPAVGALIGKLPEEKRVIAYPYYLQSLNFGAVFGIGIAMIVPFVNELKHFSPLSFGSFFFILLAIYYWLFVRNLPPSEYSAKVSYSIQRVFRNRLFVRFLIVNFLYWTAYAQLTVSLPLQAFHFTHSEAWSGSIILIDSIYGLFLVEVFRSAFEKYSAPRIYLLGCAIISLCFFLVPLFSNIAWLLFSLLFFAIGETLTLPAIDLIVSKCSDQKDSNAFFSIRAFVSALGSSLGNTLGIYLMKNYAGTYIPWGIYTGIELACALLFFVLWRSEIASSNVRQTEQVS